MNGLTLHWSPIKGGLALSLSSLVLMVTGGCAHLSDNEAPESTSFSPDIPLTRLEMPEAPGRGKFQGIIYHGLNSRNVVLDTRTGSTEQSVSYDEQDGSPVVDGDYGISRRWSAGLRIRTDLKNATLKSRFQLMGKPVTESGENDFSLSLGLGYGATRHTWDNGDDDDPFEYFFEALWGGDPYVEQATIEGRYGLDIKEASLIGGYRPLHSLLVFGGGFYQDVNFHSRVTYIDPDDRSNRSTNHEIDAIWQRGGNLGLGYSFDKTFLLIMEYVRYDLNWDNKTGVDDDEAFTGGLLFRF